MHAICLETKITPSQLENAFKLQKVDFMPMAVNTRGQKTVGYLIGDNGKGGCNCIRLYYAGCLDECNPRNFGNFETLIYCTDHDFLNFLKSKYNHQAVNCPVISLPLKR